MTTITIQAIQDKHAEIGKLIMAYQAQQQPRRIEVEIDRQAIDLAAGEEYVGCIINADGTAHAIILLPGDQNDINWADAKAWAASIGGALPTRIEQAMLYASHRDKFEQRAYWSCEQHAEGAGSAWCQGFSIGSQSTCDTLIKLRARAVRRVAISPSSLHQFGADMSIVTIQAIQNKHAEIGKLIQAYQAQQQTYRIEVEIDRQSIDLFPGEEYVGCIINTNGSAHAIILLPGDHDDINWADANAWAASIGGSLPTRIEQAMLCAGHRDKFERRAYWSCEQHAEDAGCAWYQHFNYGCQDSCTTIIKLRARAVRRVAI